jgi:hypothetical protein
VLGCNSETNVVSTEDDNTLLKSGQPGNGFYDLSNDEIDGLTHMRIEEKLARDVYTVLGDKWNARVFLNIKISEQTHMDAIKRLLIKYNITDPLITDEVGIFPDEDFQNLYNELVLKGNQSLKDALLVGVEIEELDIKDLDFQLTNVVDSPDIIRVYTNLKFGSLNHLAAFNRNLVSHKIKPVIE